jgi:hypothetical protein
VHQADGDSPVDEIGQDFQQGHEAAALDRHRSDGDDPCDYSMVHF